MRTSDFQWRVTYGSVLGPQELHLLLRHVIMYAGHQEKQLKLWPCLQQEILLHSFVNSLLFVSILWLYLKIYKCA